MHLQTLLFSIAALIATASAARSCYAHNNFGVKDHGCVRCKNNYQFEFVETGTEKGVSCDIGRSCCRGICCLEE